MDFKKIFQSAKSTIAGQKMSEEQSIALSQEAKEIFDRIKLRILTREDVVGSFSRVVLDRIAENYRLDGDIATVVKWTDADIFPHREHISKEISHEFENTVSEEHKDALKRHPGHHLSPRERKDPFYQIPYEVIVAVQVYINSHYLADCFGQLKIKQATQKNSDGAEICYGVCFFV